MKEKTAEPNINYILPIDGLRGFAVLSVIFFHYTNSFYEQLTGREWFHPLYKLLTFGWLGVDLFFVLSGFLITRILLANLGSAHYYGAFYGRRTLRIFPLYYAVLILYFIILPLLNVPIAAGEVTKNQFYLWTYTTNLTYPLKSFGDLGHFWTLAVEEHFYLLWPVSIKIFEKRGLRGFCLSVIGISLLSKFIMAIAGLNYNFIFLFSLNRFDSLALGSLLAIVNHQNTLPRFLTKEKISRTFNGMFITAVLSLIFLYNESNAFIRIYQLFFFACFFCVVVQLINTDKENMVTKLFSYRLLRIIGLYSYGLYIFHLPVERITAKIFSVIHFNTWAQDNFSSLTQNFFWCLLSFILTLLCSIISYHFFEKNFLNLKKYFQF